MKEEDTEFQERHHAKEKAVEIARKWKSKVTNNTDDEFDFKGNEKLIGARQRLVSIPFAGVPAASRLRSNIQDFGQNNSNYRPSFGINESYMDEVNFEQIYQPKPLARIRVEEVQYYKQHGVLHSIYYTESEASNSSGLGSISIHDSVFNSPVSSHFYCSPGIVMQNSLLLDSPGHIYEVINGEKNLFGHSGAEFKYGPVHQLYSSQSSTFGSRLPYLSPLAPDYIKRNLSNLSRSLTSSSEYPSVYSLGPSSFHSSKWYDEVAKRGKTLNSDKISRDIHSYERCSSRPRTSSGNEYEGNRVLNWKPKKRTSNIEPLSRRSVSSTISPLDSSNRENKAHQSDNNFPWAMSIPRFNNGNLFEHNRAERTINVQAIRRNKVMKKVEEKISRKELVKMIEKYSRILFPLTFILFNMFYWPYIYNR